MAEFQGFEVLDLEALKRETLKLAVGAVAQLGERLVCNQEATGSIPVSSTIQQEAISRALQPYPVEAQSLGLKAFGLFSLPLRRRARAGNGRAGRCLTTE